MEILNQFGINPILLLAQIVNFLILLFILKRFAYKPILKVLGERRQKIEDSLKNAEEIEKRLTETNEKIDTMIAKASNEAQKILDESKKEGVLYLEETKQRAGQMAEDIVEKGRESLAMERERMTREVKAEVADLVVAVFSKITGKQLSKKDQKDLIEREVKNLS